MSEKNNSGIKLPKGWDFDLIAKYVYIAVICLCGMMLRNRLTPHTSRDMEVFLLRWYDYFAEHGGFKAVGDDIGDYTPLYYYYLAFLTYLKDVTPQMGIKLLSILFDFIMAVYVMWIVELREKDMHLPIIAFGTVFCLPTVVLNSAAWGQCDVIYSCFLVMCLYYLLIGKDKTAMIMFGVSFSFKLQAIFFAPLIGIMLFKKKIKPQNLLWIPAVYIISIFPAVLAGGDFVRLLTVYVRQSGQYSSLNMSLPNLWALWEGVGNELLGPAGIFFGGACVVTVMYYYITRKQLKITENTVVALAMISSFVVPFVLPHMHERYYYITEVMFVIFAFYYRKRVWLIFTSQYCSVQCLSDYLLGKEYLDIRLLTLIEIVNIIVVYLCLKDEMTEPRDEELLMEFEKGTKKAVKGRR